MVALELALDNHLLELGFLIAAGPSQYRIDGLHRVGLAFNPDIPGMDRESEAV